MKKNYCSNCGSPINNSESKYCESCGESLCNTDNSDLTSTQYNSEEESYRINRPNTKPSQYSQSNEIDEINETYGMNNSNTIPSPNRSQRENNQEKIRYHKNKYLAFILSIFPGIGQVYNGQFLKGILFPVFMLLFTLISVHFYDYDPWSGISAILVFITYFYSLADAFKTANDINQNNGNYFYSDNEENNLDNENNLNSFQIADAEISSYFHERGYNGAKTLSLIKTFIFIVVLYFVLFYIIGTY